MKKQTLVLIFLIIFLQNYSQEWNQKSNYPGGNDAYFGFVINDKAYVGGNTASCFYEYEPIADTWVQKSPMPFGYAMIGAFSIGDYGYIIHPWANEVWQYDPIQNQWIQKNDFPGQNRSKATSFSFNGKGYYGLGGESPVLSDFWEYDPVTDSWTQLSDMPIGRGSAVSFLIGDNAYVGAGRVSDDQPYYGNDFWKYNFDIDSWVQIANLPGYSRGRSVAFTISNKAFVGTGLSYESSYNYLNDFWQYEPLTDNWIQLDDFTGERRQGAVGFSINNKGYITSGYDGTGFVTVYPDLWEYTLSTLIPENKQKHTKLSAYLNSTNDVINIIIPNSYEGVSIIDVVSTKGELIKSINVNEKEVQLSVKDWIKGLYVIRVKNDNSVYTQKLMVY